MASRSTTRDEAERQGEAATDRAADRRETALGEPGAEHERQGQGEEHQGQEEQEEVVHPEDPQAVAAGPADEAGPGEGPEDRRRCAPRERRLGLSRQQHGERPGLEPAVQDEHQGADDQHEQHADAEHRRELGEIDRRERLGESVGVVRLKDPERDAEPGEQQEKRHDDRRREEEPRGELNEDQLTVGAHVDEAAGQRVERREARRRHARKTLEGSESRPISLRKSATSSATGAAIS